MPKVGQKYLNQLCIVLAHMAWATGRLHTARVAEIDGVKTALEVRLSNQEAEVRQEVP